MFLLKKTFSSALRSCFRISSFPQLVQLPYRSNASYEGISKTHADIINKKDPRFSEYKMIESYSTVGFRLTDTTFVCGPMILIENHCFCWNIKNEQEIDHKSLEFFMHIHPPLDILVIGYADVSFKEMFSKNIHLFGKLHNIAIELLPVEKAIATFNFLVSERRVGGAFLPVRSFIVEASDIILDNIENKTQTFELEPVYGDEVFMRTYPNMPKYVRRKKKKTKDNEETTKQIKDEGQDGKNN